MLSKTNKKKRQQQIIKKKIRIRLKEEVIEERAIASSLNIQHRKVTFNSSF